MMWFYHKKLRNFNIFINNSLVLVFLFDMANTNLFKWNLEVLISDLLFFVFQFHICLPNYGFRNMLYSPLMIKVSSKFISWATKSLLEIKYKSFLVWKFWSAWQSFPYRGDEGVVPLPPLAKICSFPSPPKFLPPTK